MSRSTICSVLGGRGPIVSGTPVILLCYLSNRHCATSVSPGQLRCTPSKSTRDPGYVAAACLGGQVGGFRSWFVDDPALHGRPNLKLQGRAPAAIADIRVAGVLVEPP